MKTGRRMLAVLLALVLGAGLVACQKQGAKNAFAKPDDLKGRRLSVQAGTTGQELAEELSGKENVSAFERYADALTELKQKKVDGLVMDGEPAKLLVAGNPDLVILDEALSVEQYAVAVKKGNTELLEAINAVIEAQKASGEIERNVQAYLEDEVKAAETLDYNEAATGGVLRLGTESGFAPYESRIGDRIAGSDIQLAADIARSLDMKLVVEDMAFDGLLVALDKGTIDFVAAGMTVTEERRKSVDFSESYFDATQVIIIRSEDFKKP